MINLRYSAGLLGLLTLALSSCSGGSSSKAGSAGSFDLTIVSNGFGQLLPHQAYILDEDGLPTSNIISIQSQEDLLANVHSGNLLLPTPTFSDSTTLPNGESGNHFMVAHFTEEILRSSVLSNLPSSIENSNLAGTITVVTVDPASGRITPLTGRAFIGGETFGTVASKENPADPAETSEIPVLWPEQWVSIDPSNPAQIVANDLHDGRRPGVGFPGTEGPGFQGHIDLVSPKAFVFIPDADDDLSTHETFPSGVTVMLKITTGVRGGGTAGATGRNLNRNAVAASTVGADTITPEVRITLPPNSSPLITPGAGARDVDPLTSITVEFSEPIQPGTLGDLPLGKPPTESPAMSIKFGPGIARTTVPFLVEVPSVLDMTRFRLTPTFNFPGEGPVDAECGIYNKIDVIVNPAQIADLVGNVNTLNATTHFYTGEGPGLINAPVSPDTIYVGRGGPQPGVSVIDLNGYGGGTGNPVYDQTFENFEEGWTHFPYNPNVKLQGSMLRPALTVGSCTINGGSSGVFTLVRDTSLNDLLIRNPVVLKSNDMMLGHALDSLFNNAPAPFGCQSGGGNLCAQTGQKIYQAMQGGPNTLTHPPILNNPILVNQPGAENPVSWAPHPNPPPMRFPPLCISPYIGGQEPTSVDVTLLLPPLQNLLVPGDPFGDPGAGIPPEGMLSPEQNAWFQGPSMPSTTISACAPYMIRQQIGQFLYVVDRGRKEVVVFNSNRMTVIDRILTPDPTTLAMSPNLDFLAVANQAVNLVTFIDINPASATFHQVVHESVVGRSPRGIAWESGNEDILVCNEVDSTVSIISAFTLEVRKTVSSGLQLPFDVIITPRQTGFGFQRGVYFAYIMNRNGKLAIFESGPNAVNGWGYDNVIGSATQTFKNPKTLQPDLVNINSALWIVHEGPIDPETNQEGDVGVPAVTNLKIESGIVGQLPLNAQSLTIPQFRDLGFAVGASLGPEVLSGVPVDMAFDNMRNFGGTPNFQTMFSAGVPLPLNGKSLVRTVGGISNTCEPKFLFLAIPNSGLGASGVVDVIDIGGGYNLVDTNPYRPGTQSIPVSDAQVLMDYFRQ